MLHEQGPRRRGLGDKRGAVALYEQAIEIRERLVNQEGRRELAGDLAWVQLCWANDAWKIGRQAEAAKIAKQTIRTLESEIQRNRPRSLTGVLDWARRETGGSAIARDEEPMPHGDRHKRGCGGQEEPCRRLKYAPKRLC